MALPYENSRTGDKDKALFEIQKVLRAFGCGKFGSMMDFDAGVLLVQFDYRGRQVSVKASVAGYAAAWLKEHPFNSWTRLNKIAYERKAKEIGAKAVYSILRDWIKGQITAIETGVLSFEGAFLGQILLPTGRTVFETVKSQKLLPSPKEA